MKLKQLVDRLKEGRSIEDLKPLLGADINFEKIKSEEKVDALFKKMKALPFQAFADDRNKYKEELMEARSKWPTIVCDDVDSIESVTDFSDKTDKRIKITIENYQKYFDGILSDSNAGDNEADLEMTIYDVEHKKSFKATMFSTATFSERQRERSWLPPVDYTNPEFIYLASYIIAVPGSENDNSITVAEAAARGQACMSAFNIAGKYINIKFKQLMKDFF